MWCVYLLKSEKANWYYVGSTDNLDRRIHEHNKRGVSSTKHFAPLSIVFVKEFQTEGEARKYERLVKDKRIEKEQIIKSLL